MRPLGRNLVLVLFGAGALGVASWYACFRLAFAQAGSIDRARGWHENGVRRIYGWQLGEERVGMWMEFDEQGRCMPNSSGFYVDGQRARELSADEILAGSTAYRSDDLWALGAQFLSLITKGHHPPGSTSEYFETAENRSHFPDLATDLRDPWGRAYRIELLGETGCDLLSLGADDRTGGVGDDEDMLVHVRKGNDLEFEAR